MPSFQMLKGLLLLCFSIHDTNVWFNLVIFLRYSPRLASLSPPPLPVAAGAAFVANGVDGNEDDDVIAVVVGAVDDDAEEDGFDGADTKVLAGFGSLDGAEPNVKDGADVGAVNGFVAADAAVPNENEGAGAGAGSGAFAWESPVNPENGFAVPEVNPEKD